MKLGDAHMRAYRRAIRRVESQDIVDAVQARIDGLQLHLDQDIAHDGDLMLPVGKGQPSALVGRIAAANQLAIVAPVCPPLVNFDGAYAPAISAEAHAALRASRSLLGGFAARVGLDVQVTILVADTEDDLPQVADKIGLERYREICQESAGLIETVAEVPIKVSTFSDYFSGLFRSTQYLVEDVVRSRIDSDEPLRKLLQRVSDERAAKHQQILGRPEQDNELAIRYVAQYAALGRIARTEQTQIDGILNYQTPNLSYINHPLAGEGVVPVFESRRRAE